MSNRLPVIAAEIQRAHDDARTAARFSAERAIEAGRLLIEAKASLGHGEWLPWLRASVGMSERTAQGYMRIAKAGLKSATVADLGLRATMARIARRATPRVTLVAGQLLTLHAGRHFVTSVDGSSEQPYREHELWLWSTDGSFAWKWQFYGNPEIGPDRWLSATWKKPVSISRLGWYLAQEGFPLAEAEIARSSIFRDPQWLANLRDAAQGISDWFHEKGDYPPEVPRTKECGSDGARP